MKTPSSLRVLARAVHDCRNCDLWKDATQGVPGEGPPSARIVFVGEQPGDAEDRQGRPFVGPAGRLFDGALEAAGLDRANVYITNAVKHFKWTPRGKRRMHAKPNASEVNACHPWLEAELRLIRPQVLVCLGATAAQVILGKQFRVTRDRGEWQRSELVPWVMATFHPAALLRAPDPAAREAAKALFFADVAKAAERASSTGRGASSRRADLRQASAAGAR